MRIVLSECIISPHVNIVYLLPWCCKTGQGVLQITIQEGGKFRDGNISLWEISYFKCVRNFPLNFQATVRNKPGAKFSHDA